ncbi:MAG: oligopeptide/dipeptide ABC transporter ATP-binding protein [Thermoleophilia bacterium]
MLDGINLSVGEGEAVGLVGESGAGKTTLAALAAGLELPSAGGVSISGPDPDPETGGFRKRGKAARLKRARQLQLIWQDARGSLDPRMKIGAALAEPLRIHGLDSRHELDIKVSALMSETGLDASLRSRYPHELSGGEVQRVVIARALALDPAVLVCDEPASSLDAGNKVRIARLLSRLRRERGLALLVIAHDLGLVRVLTERIFIIYRGRIVESGPTAAVLDNPLHPYTRLLVSCDPSMPGWNKMLGATGTQPGRKQVLRPHLRGCGFACRCSQKSAACQGSAPELSSWGEDRRVACLNPVSAADVAEHPVERLTGILEG